MSIPLRNVYLLLCYASGHLQEAAFAPAEGERVARPEDLFARVLAGGVARLLRRGIGREYVEREEELSIIRGRIDVARSMRASAVEAIRYPCRFTELTEDTLPNRLVKATMARLCLVDALDRSIRERLEASLRPLMGVRSIRPTDRDFAALRGRRLPGGYGFPLAVCELVHGALAPIEGGGRFVFRDFTRDERAMAGLFEAFVRNYFRFEFAGATVKRDVIEWDVLGAPEALALLPQMRTDAILRSPAGTTLIETKYYAKALDAGQYGAEKIRAGHLYQLAAYLRSLAARGGPDACARGLLLYASDGTHFDAQYTLGNHPIRVCTVDLSARWVEIVARLRLLGAEWQERVSTRRVAAVAGA